jgi:hypothetical protein
MVMTFDGKTSTVVRNGKTEDIIAALIAAVPEAVRQFKNNKPTTHTGNLIKDATNACMFVRDRVKYKADGFNFQDIQFPGRMLFHTKQADCKSFSLAALANLLSQGYNGGFRFVSYRPNKVPTHVYIFVLDKSGNKFTFDPCIKNLKESNKATHIIDMDVRYLSEPVVEIAGRAERQARRAARREKRQERREDRQERRAAGDKPKGVPKVALAPARGAFLTLTTLNFRGLATRLDQAIQKDSKKVQQFWNKLGGDFSKLKSNVDKNKGKKPLFGKGKGIDGISFSDEFISEIENEFIGAFEDYYLTEDTSKGEAQNFVEPVRVRRKRSLAEIQRRKRLKAQRLQLQKSFEDNAPIITDDSYIGAEPASTTAATTAAVASPILLALTKFLKDLKIKDVADAAGKIVPLLKKDEAEATTPIDPTGEGFEASDAEPGSGQKTTGGASFAPSPMLIGGLAGAAVLIYFLTKKKGK